MSRLIEVASYGLAIFSIEGLSNFLSLKKNKSKNVLKFFQNNHKEYLESLESGIWIPILPIDSIEYEVKIGNLDESFDSNWKLKFNYDGFNLDIIDNTFWIISSGQLADFDKAKYEGNDIISYKTLDGEILNSGFRFNVDSGKYKLSISGYERNEEVEYPQSNYGYLFILEKVDSFQTYNDPREDDKFNFNLSE